MEKIPQEIIIEILEYLPLQELLKMEQINKQFRKIIRENKWKNLIVYINKNMDDVKLLKKFITNHNFINYDFKDCEIITDKILKFLKKCHTLNLDGYNQITDHGLSYLTNCHTLKLYGCNKISQKLINELRQKGINVIC